MTLDIYECRSHYKEFTCNFHVIPLHGIPLHGVYIIHVLLGDRNDRDIIDIYFVFVYKVHEKIERTFKDLQFYLK